MMNFMGVTGQDQRLCWTQSEMEVDAGTPEGERTPAETYAFPPK